VSSDCGYSCACSMYSNCSIPYHPLQSYCVSTELNQVVKFRSSFVFVSPGIKVVKYSNYILVMIYLCNDFLSYNHNLTQWKSVCPVLLKYAIIFNASIISVQFINPNDIYIA
jgi:hypothetical protein